MTLEAFLPVLAFLIAFLLAIVDLLQIFSGRTLRQAIRWTIAYAVCAGLIALAIFALLTEVDVSIGPVSATPLIKAIISGLMFKPLIQSKLFMVKTKDLDEPNYGPAATYEKLSNVIKKQISLTSVATNVQLISDYLTTDLSDLRAKVVSVIFAHEMWGDEEKKNQIRTIDEDVALLTSAEAKKLRLALFLQQYGPNLDLGARFRKKVLTLHEAHLIEIGERIIKSKTIADPSQLEYFRQQLHEPNVRVQTLRKLIISYCTDTKIMDHTLSNS